MPSWISGFPIWKKPDTLWKVIVMLWLRILYVGSSEFIGCEVHRGPMIFDFIEGDMMSYNKPSIKKENIDLSIQYTFISRIGCVVTKLCLSEKVKNLQFFLIFSIFMRFLKVLDFLNEFWRDNNQFHEFYAWFDWFQRHPEFLKIS